MLLPLLQAMNQPPGRLSQRQHMNCILPLFLELLSWGLLRLLWSQATSLGSRRANSRLQKAQAKRKKLLAELKVHSCAGMLSRP